MTDLKELQLFATPEHDCSYLPERKAKTLFVDPQAIVSTRAYSRLSEMGFRRSGSHIYRPHCHNCQACVSVRVPVQLFIPNKTQRRIINRNKDLKIKRTSPRFSEEIFSLYSTYINERHADGDMYPPSREQFVSFLVEGEQRFDFFEFRLQDRLIAVAVTDILSEGLSATYTFFDPSPEMEKRSLGAFAILWQIEACKKAGLEHLYLGYWVQGCRKMHYKIAYRPLEFLIDSQWLLIR